MPPGTRSNPEKNNDYNVNIISFLKCGKFNEVINKIVIRETNRLQQQFADFKNELSGLKQSNIEMVRLLSSPNYYYTMPRI